MHIRDVLEKLIYLFSEEYRLHYDDQPEAEESIAYNFILWQLTEHRALLVYKELGNFVNNGDLVHYEAQARHLFDMLKRHGYELKYPPEEH